MPHRALESWEVYSDSYPVDELFCPALEPVDLKAALNSLVGAHDRLGVISPAIHQGATSCPV